MGRDKTISAVTSLPRGWGCGSAEDWFDPLPGNFVFVQLEKGFAMTLTKILSRTPANVSRLALKAAGIAMVGFVLCPTAAHAQGGIPLWTNRYNGPGNGEDSAYANTVAVDSSNNVIVTGSSYNGANNDYATIQYSSAGVPLWTNRYNGPGNGDDTAIAVAVDGGNSVIVTGYSTGSGSGLDYATIKYSSTGVPLWINRYNGPGNGDDDVFAVAVDGSNNVIVTGEDYNGANYDYVTIKYLNAGLPLWTNRYNGPRHKDDIATALAVDSNNDVIVTGFSDNGTNNENNDYTTIAYSSVGVPLWTNNYNGPGNDNDFDYSIAVDHSNNVIVTGGSIDSGTGEDYATIKYSSIILSPIPLNFQTAGNQMVLSWANAAFGLQSAPAVTGTFTNIPGAASLFTNPISGGQQFFRLMQ